MGYLKNIAMLGPVTDITSDDYYLHPLPQSQAPGVNLLQNLGRRAARVPRLWGRRFKCTIYADMI